MRYRIVRLDRDRVPVEVLRFLRRDHHTDQGEVVQGGHEVRIDVQGGPVEDLCGLVPSGSLVDDAEVEVAELVLVIVAQALVIVARGLGIVAFAGGLQSRVEQVVRLLGIGLCGAWSASRKQGRGNEQQRYARSCTNASRKSAARLIPS